MATFTRAIAGLVVVLFATASTSNAANAQVAALFDDYVKWKMTELDPQNGYLLGFDWFPKPKLNNYSLAHYEGLNKKCEDFKQQVAKNLLLVDITDSEKKYLELMRYEVDTCLSGHKHKGYLLAPVMSRRGVQGSLTSFFADELKYESIDDYEHNLDLMRKIPQQLEEIQELLVGGVQENITHANESLYRAVDQFDRLQVSDPTESEFYKQFEKIKDNLPEVTDEEAARLQDKARTVIKEHILPSFKKLQEYVFGEYYEHLRPEAGVHSLPNGQEYYQACIDYFTSLRGVNASEIHQIGLEEIKNLRQQAEKSAFELGMGNLTFTQIAEMLRTDDSNKFSNDTEAFDFVKKQAEVINQELDKIFSEEILQDYVYQFDIKPVPPGRGGYAYYNDPSRDGTRNGAFFLNPAYLTKTETTALVLHEANPGHHLQISTSLNNDDAPLFYTASLYFYQPSNPGTYISYAEGWGLYSEYLGHEMGVYDKDKQIFGYYSLNLLRAGRLVVDTGMHSLGWSRQEAVDYLMENTFANEANIGNQVDRYVGWPGQALAYKMGERTIQSVRKSLEKQRGEDFQVKNFHDGVLNCQGPLNYLEECVADYV